MDAHRATAARMRAASGALPAFNGAEFGDGGDLDYGGGDSGEDGGLGGEEVYDEEEDELEEEEEEEEDMPRKLSSARTGFSPLLILTTSTDELPHYHQLGACLHSQIISAKYPL